MKPLVATLFLIMFASLSVAASANETPVALEQWREQRLARLTSETGWLTLVGLHWLREGENAFARDASNRLVPVKPAEPNKVGTFTLADGAVTFTAAPNATVLLEGSPVTSLRMKSDTEGAPTVLASDSLRFFVVERSGRIGIRVRDVEHPARTNFQGLDYFAADDEWVIEARFEPYSPARRIPILNILGLTDQMVSPGAVIFTKNGREWRLDTLLEAPDDDQLFIMFADQTSGRETYGAGRFMYVPLPQNGRVTLDFNRAYSPPCAFNEFATCPLPPAQNRLAMRVEAGEKKYRAANNEN